MPFNGTGIFQRVRNWVADATAGIKIRADYHDAEDDGFAAGLSNCITKDGQTTVTQNIPWNSKRITGLQDPVNSQDAATMAYADTKLSGAGGKMTGDLEIEKNCPYIILDDTDMCGSWLLGQHQGKNRWIMRLGNGEAETGSNVGSNFDLNRYDDAGTYLGAPLIFNRATGLGSVSGNPTAALGIATKQYADLKLPITGGDVTGYLWVAGELLAKAGYIRFTTTGGNGYLQYSGGPNYDLGGGGRIWHSGNFNPASLGTIQNGRWVVAGSHNHTTEGQAEPFGGAAVTGCGYPEAYPHGTLILMYRYLQMYSTGWFTVGYA